MTAVTQTDKLVFRFDARPPAKTLQSGRGAFAGADGRVHFFTKSGVRSEAWQMRADIGRQLPDGWTPSREPARVKVTLVYPERKTDRLPRGGFIPHVERPDADNLVKSILDSMTRARVWDDDAQVFDLRVRKFRGAVPFWEVAVEFGGYGFLDGGRHPLWFLKRLLTQRRRGERLHPAQPSAEQPTLDLGEGAP